MSKLKFPTIPEVAAFQKAALAEVVRWMAQEGFGYRVEGDGSAPDASLQTIHPSRTYKVIAHVDEGKSPVVALWVLITTQDGSGTYSEWHTKLNGEWIGTEDLSDYDGASGTYSWEA